MLTGPRQRAILGYVLGSASYVLEIALTPLILPVLRTSFGLSLAEVTFVTNGYALAVVLSVLTAGWLGDRVGPKRVFLAGAVLYAGASLLVALAGGLEALLAFRLLQGLGAGLFSAMIPVLLARAGGDRPGRLLALWYSSSGFVVASAPLLAAPLVASFGWRAVYVAVAIVALPACALALRSRDAPAAIRAPGGGRLRDLARDPRCAVLFLYVALNYGSIMLFLFAAPLFTASQPALQGAIPILLGAFWVSFTVAGIATRNLVDGRHAVTLLVLSPLLIAAGFTALFAGPWDPLPFIAALLVGTGFAMGNTPSTHLILKHAPQGTTALAASIDITFARIGSVLLIAALGPAQPAMVAGGIAAVSAATVLCVTAYLAATRGARAQG